MADELAGSRDRVQTCSSNCLAGPLCLGWGWALSPASHPRPRARAPLCGQGQARHQDGGCTWPQTPLCPTASACPPCTPSAHPASPALLLPLAPCWLGPCSQVTVQHWALFGGLFNCIEPAGLLLQSTLPFSQIPAQAPQALVLRQLHLCCRSMLAGPCLPGDDAVPTLQSSSLLLSIGPLSTLSPPRGA